ncbi:MAG TPA: START domain-containing protein [Puia sp.]
MEFNADHWILLGYWTLFSIIHHITASEKFKAVCKPVMGAGFRYYRLMYSAVSCISLGWVLYWQFHIASPKLGVNPVLKYFLGLPIGISGIFLMGASIRKYFLNLSCINVFLNENRLVSLEYHGMHKYIRHPLYLGTLLLIWSLLVFDPTLSNLLACLAITVYTLVGIRFEEEKLLTTYGQAYESYCRKTPRLVPNIRLRELFLLLFMMIWVTTLPAQENWKLKTEKEGIKVYSSPFADSKIKALKVICTAEATLSQMTAVLLNIKEQDEWFYRTKSTILKQVSPTELYYYGEVDFPVPFSNRDFVERILLSQNPVTKIVTMEVQNLPDYIPPKKDIVRVTKSHCSWVIKPVNKNLILIEFKLFADPGGSIPSWLVNMMSTYGPFEIFKKLKTELQKPEYALVNFPFIKD